MATYLSTKMKELADIIREKSGETGLMSVTSMISMILRQGTLNTDGLKPFLERSNSNHYPNGIMPLPEQAESIGPYAFAYFSDISSLTKARGIQYGVSAFYSCAISNNMQNYNAAGGTFSAAYDTTPAPDRKPHGAVGPEVDPVVKAALLNPTRYANASIDTYFEGLASTVRAVTGLTDPLTIQQMIDNVSATTIAGNNNVLAQAIDRTLTTLDVPTGVVSLGAYALRGCANLSSVSLPSTIVRDGLDGYADDGYLGGQFLDCHSTFHLTLYGNVSIYAKIAGESGYICTYKGYTESSTCYFYSTTISRDLTGESDVNTVTYSKANGKFISRTTNRNGYLSATSLYFNGVDCIEGGGAFAGLSTQFVDLNNVSYVGNHTFSGCKQLTSVAYPTASTVRICSNAFQNTGFTSVLIPNTVNIFGAAVFQGCDYLKYASINGSPGTILHAEFMQGCPELEKVVVTGGVTALAFECFDSCHSLVSISLTNSIAHIDTYAFWSCVSLINFTFPTNLETIGPSAFLHASSLTSANMGQTKLKSVGSSAFAECPNLESVVLPTTVVSLMGGAFNAGQGLIAHPKSFSAGSEYSTNDGWKSTYRGYYSRYTTGDTTYNGTQFYAWSRVAGTGETIYYTQQSAGLPVGYYLYKRSNGEIVYDRIGDSYCLTMSVYCSSIRCLFPSSIIFNTGRVFKYTAPGDDRCFYFPNG